MEFLEFEHRPKIQFEAAWAITNIASGTEDHTKTVIEYGALPKFVKLLKSKNDESKEQAIWALGNIAGDNVKNRDLVLNHGVLDNLLPICSIEVNTKSKINMVRNVAWTISNLCRGLPTTKWKYVNLSLKAMSIMINKFIDNEILKDICWTISFLSEIDDSEIFELHIEGIVKYGLLNKIIKLLNHKSLSIQQPCSRVIGNIATKDVDIILRDDTLKQFKKILNNRNGTALKKECCWTLSNILANDYNDIQKVIDYDLIPLLIQSVKTETFDIAKEALWGLSNATDGGNDKQIQYMVNYGIIQVFCKFIKRYYIDGNGDGGKSLRVLMVTLEGIENILAAGKRLSLFKENKYVIYVKEYGGIDCLEQLQCIKDQSICDKAVEIVTRYFDLNECCCLERVNVIVPARYVCFKCKSVGKHWIMDCNMEIQHQFCNDSRFDF